jgi:hypothetical protein
VHGIRYLDLRVGYYPPTNKTDTKDHGTRYATTGVTILVVLKRQDTTRGAVLKTKCEDIPADSSRQKEMGINRERNSNSRGFPVYYTTHWSLY